MLRPSHKGCDLTDNIQPPNEKARLCYACCWEPDPCIGYVPGAKAACCGHGDSWEKKTYVWLPEGALYGQEAIEYLQVLRNRPWSEIISPEDREPEAWYRANGIDVVTGVLRGRVSAEKRAD